MVAAVPLVPPSVQHAIKARTALYAYMPTRVAANTTYRRWRFTTAPRPELRILFDNHAALHWSFAATPYSGPCDAGRKKTFQLAGNKVYWGLTATGQRAWRCVKGAGGRAVMLIAATTLPPTRFADVGLGTIVASARRIP